MIPFELLYGRKCNVPVRWDNLVNRLVVGPKILQGNGIEGSQDKTDFEDFSRKEKSYGDKDRVHREF